MTIIYLVRHGRTDFIGKKLCGNLPGIHLNEEGKGQAQKVADYLTAFPIKAIFSSPIERAMETAAPLASRLGLSVKPEDFLREIHFGDLQGQQEDPLQSNPYWLRFNQHPEDVAFPNGESVKRVQARVADGLNELCKEFDSDDQIVCVAHSEVLRLAVAYAIHLPVDEFHHLSIDPASVSKLEWTAERKKLRLLNFQPE